MPKNPPNNIEAEQSLLCSFLLGNKPDDAMAILEPEDFYKKPHQNIFTAVHSLYKNREPLGSAEVVIELQSMNKFDNGMGTYIAQLMDMPQAVNISHVAKIIKECSSRRKLIEIADRMAKSAYSNTIDLVDLVENARADIKSLGLSKKGGSLAQQIRDWVCLQDGTFNLQTIYTCLQLSTRDEKKNVSIILKRLSEGEDRLVVKYSGVAGTYKTVSKTAKLIDLSNRSDLKGELLLKFPFGIENYIKPMPGCVFIIAGETDSGKSAFLMNFAKKNTPMFKVNYYSSEMGKQELFDRTDHFWPDIGEDKNLVFFEDCYEDFDQLIEPDAINIIDYLELFDNFYLMASIIDEIGRALKSGIVFIALQKPKNRDEGTGGERTKNLARLYLSLRPGILKIVKAKNWRDSKVNPNGLEIDFKLIEGCKFHNTEPWRKP